MLVVVQGQFGTAKYMGAGLLLIPTVAHVDHAIPQTVAVSDQEMVSQALVSKGNMLPMDRFRITGWIARMMNHNEVQRLESTGLAI